VPAGGRPLRRAGAGAVGAADSTVVTAGLPDSGRIGRAVASTLDAGRKLALRRLAAAIPAAAAVIHVGLVLLDGDAVATALVRAVGADAAGARGIASAGAAVGTGRAAPAQRSAPRCRPACPRRHDGGNPGHRSAQEGLQRGASGGNQGPRKVVESRSVHDALRSQPR
jgi:hypothetical protein